MAQKKDMEEKPKRAKKPKAKSNALPVEQINELMFITTKMIRKPVFKPSAE